VASDPRFGIGYPGRPKSGSPRSSFCGDNFMDLAPDFNEFVGSLNAQGVEFLIVGAYALAFHGAPRFTGDLDLWFHPTIENASRVLAAVRAFGFPIDRLEAAEIIDPRRMLEMGTEPVQIHVMSAISGVSWDEAWNTRVAGTCGEHAVSFLGREAFIKNKRAAARPKDLADVDALEPGQDS
jgi:hypothetical protein